MDTLTERMGVQTTLPVKVSVAIHTMLDSDSNFDRHSDVKGEETLRLRLHVPSTSPFFVPFKIGFDAVLLRRLHLTLKKSKVPLTKTVTLTVRVNKPLVPLILVRGRKSESLLLIISMTLLKILINNLYATDKTSNDTKSNVLLHFRFQLLSVAIFSNILIR